MAASWLSIVIFITILFIQIYSEDTFDCTGYEDDSVHPVYNTNNCRHYWHCIYVGTNYMRAIKRTCPAGTEFDFQLKECEISSLVNCVLIRSFGTSRISMSTRKYIKLFPHTQSLMTKKHSLVNQDKSTNMNIITQKFKVLPMTSSQLTPIFSFEQLIKKLNAIPLHSKYKSVIYTIEPKIYNTTNQPITSQSISIPTTTEMSPTISKYIFVTSKMNQKHIHHQRDNLILNILTSHERKIRQFSINQTHGILIQCNEIRRRQLRDLIFRTTTTTTTNSLKLLNSSSKIFYYDILSLKIFIISFLFLQKISD
ncbi:unnamed protein product [Rotaria sordida]|uniref:Chitin-binding type-2 domain-containing protein n=1 Tax=Rotaria sordida TaxID=392033 RepID=A0A814WX74_9BILA|nr:unnamed protein product [Rotaria sordida]CAF1358828.1 unnamed protein product [Rotaria sordida]